VRRRVAPAALGLGILAAAAIAVASLSRGGDGPSARTTSGGGATATVERRTLVQRETVDGTLGYAGSHTVINRLGSSGNGSPSGSDSPASNTPATASTPAATAQAALFTQDDDTEQPDEKPDGKQPDGKQDDGKEDDDQDSTTPDSTKPDSSNPESSNPDSSNPDSSNPDSSNPDSSNPDSSLPDSSNPDSSDPSYNGSGTVTALPRAGSVIERGETLYRLDGDPIVLMYGSTPAYRALESGVSDGRDVRELEQNLVALGFDPGAVDDSFTSATAAAVSDWQESVGLERTGAVELGRVVFLPGPRRIGEHKTSVGSVLSSGSEVLATSSTKRVVSVELDASLQDMARKGEKVVVTLPDGATVRGRITVVGRVAREVESSSSDPNAEKQLVIDLTIELRSKRGIGRLDEAPVGVGLAQESRRHVLAVPVNALVARRGGGYGLELADTHRIVPVEAGLFADGYVEVSGGGVREGTRVVVPRE
jgi:hypothetical protein